MQTEVPEAVTSAAIDEVPSSIAFPLIRPPFGGAVAARLADGELRLSYSGPAPFGEAVGQMLGTIAACLGSARQSRFIVEGVRFDATFTDEAEGDDDTDDEEGGE